MQQEMWAMAKLQILSSLQPVNAMRAANNSFIKSSSTFTPTVAHTPSSTNTRITFCNNGRTDIQPHSTACINGNSTSEGLPTPAVLTTATNPIKASRTHQELHKELLLAHKKGLVVCSRPELQLVLERRRREQTEREEEEQTRSPLEQVLLRRQQRQQEVKEKERELEKVNEDTQLLEFVKVRQNLRKIHSALYKASSS